MIHNQHQVCNTQDCPMGVRGLANVQIQPTQAASKEYVQIINLSSNILLEIPVIIEIHCYEHKKGD